MNKVFQISKEKRVSLKISLPINKVIALGVALFLLMTIGLELIARTTWIQTKVPFQAYGTNHVQFEMQLNNFFAFIEENGPPDCIILGTSMPFRGINPEKLQEAYIERIGKNILCYNLSTAGIHFRDLLFISMSLAGKVEPNLIIVGTSPFDFTEGREQSLDTRFTENAWLLYHIGDFSIEGWLIDTSYAFRILKLISYFAPQGLRFNDDDGVNHAINKWKNQLTPSGFGYTTAIEKNIAKPMNQGETRKFLEQFGNFTISQTNLSSLEKIIENYYQNQTDIIIVSMPYDESMVQIKDEEGNPHPEQKKLETFISELDQGISNIANKFGIPYLRPQISDQIPDDGWRDRYHLNHIGSPIFSRWLGEYLANAVETGIIKDPSIKD